ncbi:MAG: hypothetical protein LBJ00_17520 [Planctomycetaceae bacterium]|jgi:hypothetical protein|nr:hypothetical protein [Planctomycetaceae bacterium]
MKKILIILVAVLVLPQVLLQDAGSYAADNTPEFQYPTIKTFRDVGVKRNTVAGDAKNGVRGQHTKITVTPADLPYPMLKYRLNTYVTEIESGNAAPLYAEAFSTHEKILNLTLKSGVYNSADYAKAKFPELFNVPAEKIDENAIRKLQFKAFPLISHWGGELLSAVTAEQEEKLFRSLQPVYDLIEKASKKRECDWSYLVEYRGIATTFDHAVNNTRALARFLGGKAQWEIRNGKYNDAVKTLRLGFRLADHIFDSDLPFLVPVLCGLAIENVMLNNIQLLITQPDTPNLYPALTQLSRNRNILQKAMQAELLWVISDMKPRSKAEIQKSLKSFEELDENNKEDCKTLLYNFTGLLHLALSYTINGEENSKYDESQVVAGVCALCYPYGKTRLLKRGLTEAEIDKLSVYQVVTPYVVEKIRAPYDELAVAVTLPRNSKNTALKLIDDKYIANYKLDSPPDMFVMFFLPALNASKDATARVDQTIDILQIVEVIRYYAAVNDGKLPESLDKIDLLHVNTISALNNKPFAYRVESNKAIIDYEFVRGDESRLEITLEKKFEK